MYLVCGEALFDVFSTGETETGLSLDARVGGSPFNVAIGLARMGLNSALCTGMAEDFFAERLRATLRREGVSDRYLVSSQGKTTLSTVGVADDGAANYVFYGESGAEKQITPADLPSLEGIEVVHFGSYALASSPSGESFLKLAQKAKAQGALVSLDPNVRLNVVPDVALWRERINAFANHADLIKASDEDLQLLWPDEPFEQIAERWLAQGTAVVVVTQGSQGVTAYMEEGQQHVLAPEVAVVDTVGAGDTFQAALLTYLDEAEGQGRDKLHSLSSAGLRHMLKFAAQAAAITCQRRGADLPRRNELAMTLI